MTSSTNIGKVFVLCG